MNIIKNSKFIFIIVFISITGILSIPCYLIYNNVKGLIIYELGKNAMNVSIITSKLIEKDIETFNGMSLKMEKLLEKESSSKGYSNIFDEGLQNHLIELKEVTDVDSIYVISKVTELEKVYISDGGITDGDAPLRTGMKEKMLPIEHKAFNEKTTVVSDLNYDRKWEFITAYTPIMDKESGRVVALMGVDFTLNYVDRLMNGIRIVLYSCFLIMSLLASVVVNRLIHTRAQALNIDYMTGLYSKRYHEQHLIKVMNAVQFTDRVLSLVMIDVDDFKGINDKYGHVVGDKVLKSVAQILQMNTRNADICSRYGGDELTIIMPDTNKDQAASISETIRSKVSMTNFKTSNEEQLQVSLSIGIVEWDYEMSVEELSHCADQAMYNSKNSGKDKITIC